MTSLLRSTFVEPQNYDFSTVKDNAEALATSKESLFRSEVSLPKTIKASHVSILSSEKPQLPATQSHTEQPIRRRREAPLANQTQSQAELMQDSTSVWTKLNSKRQPKIADKEFLKFMYPDD